MKKKVENKFLKRLLSLFISFCMSFILFANEATQDTNYYDLKVIVDGINRIEGQLVTVIMPREKYKADGIFTGRIYII